MKRRNFIKDTFMGIPLALAAPSIMASCGEEEEFQPNGKHVVVIGAGISGLAAAKKLKENGFVVTVLESQSKVGGRLKTDRSLGFAFDEGASWIHGPKGNPITNLASQSGANTYLTSDESVTVFDINGSPYSDNILTNAESRFETAVERVERSGTLNQSFDTIFSSLYPTERNDRLWKYMLSAYLEFDTGASISQLSSKYFYDDEEFDGADVIITNGYDKVTDFLAQNLDVRLNTSVSKIDYTNEKVIVSAGNQSFESDFVVVSVPLGVLKNNKIEFVPALPKNKTDAINNTKMGNVNKFLLVWDNPFWDTNLQYIGFTPEELGKFNYFLNVKKFSSANALMTFALGSYASVTETMSDAQVTDEIMKHLKSIYGNNIPQPIKMLRTKWGQNVHTYGAYSFATNGTTTEDFNTLAQAVSNKLFFAGEHTSKDYRSTVHGAYLSGIREAENIMKAN